LNLFKILFDRFIMTFVLFHCAIQNQKDFQAKIEQSRTYVKAKSLNIAENQKSVMMTQQRACG